MLETTALKILLEVAALKRVETSTVSLAEKIGVSQQSVSRLITELAKEELLTKQPFASGMRLTLTAKGRNALLTLQGRIERILQQQPRRILQGKVEQGLGEGKYYMSMEQYKRPIANFLSAEPFPGTLNLHVSAPERKVFLTGLPHKEIPGFTDRNRTYGGLNYYNVRVGGKVCGLIIPTRTSHSKEKIELVAPFSLRHALHLSNGETITVEARER